MTNPTPMTREQAWDDLLAALKYAWSHGDADHGASLSFLRTEMERLEGERAVAIHAASLVENPEYVAALQQAGVEYVEQLVARIAELEAQRTTLSGMVREVLWRYDRGILKAADLEAIRAALPDTEGDHDLEVARQFQPLVAKAFEDIADTEGEQDG